MNASQKFVYAHHAKLAWKLVKHGVGVTLMTEGREGRKAFRPIHSEAPPEDFIELPITH